MSSVTVQNYERRVATLLDEVKDEHNRAVLARYLQERRANGIRVSTLASDANNLRDWALFLGRKRFEDATRDDAFAFASQTRRERVWRSVRSNGEASEQRRTVQLSTTTLNLRKTILRHFYKWLLGGGLDFPECVRYLQVRRGREDSIPTDALLTGEDMRKLLQAHESPMHKAMLALLYESGLRAGELCALNVGSLTYDEYGAVILLPKGVQGLKTGARKIRLYERESLPYVRAWHEAHPRKDDPSAPLFFTKSNRSRGQRLRPPALYSFVARAGLLADVKKHLHPHLFRHTAATERARMGWKEGQLRAFFGWTRSSDMPSVYVHLAGQDYEDMDLEQRGLKAKTEPTTSGLRPLVCRACKSENLPTASFCQSCRQPVSPRAEREIEAQREREMLNVFAKFVMNDPELMKEMAARVLNGRPA